MTLKELKLMAGEIIKKSEYSISAKKQLLNYILNEATEPQIKALILDGQIEILDEDATDIVNKRFDLNLVKSNNQFKKDLNNFITIIKEELCEILKEQDINLKKYEQIIDFVINKASNYQILSIFFENNIPNEEFNQKKESFLNEMAQDIINDSDIRSNKIFKKYISNLKCLFK